jgi:hypothetical protein
MLHSSCGRCVIWCSCITTGTSRGWCGWSCCSFIFMAGVHVAGSATGTVAAGAPGESQLDADSRCSHLKASVTLGQEICVRAACAVAGTSARRDRVFDRALSACPPTSLQRSRITAHAAAISPLCSPTNPTTNPFNEYRQCRPSQNPARADNWRTYQYQRDEAITSVECE